MSARFGLGLMSNSREFNRMQGKVDELYQSYNYNSNCSNLNKAANLIEENAHIQNKLHKSMENIAVEGALSRIPYTTSVYKEYYPCPPAPCTSLAQASAAAAAVAATTAAAVENDMALRRTLTRKNAEICELSMKYKKELTDLEFQLKNTKMDNCGLKNMLDETKKELTSEKCRATSAAVAKNAELNNLKGQLINAERELSTLEPRAKLAIELESHICGLKTEINHVRASNRVLADQNAAQAEIIVRSRPASPCFVLSRPASPCFVRSRPVTPCRAVSPLCRPRSISPCRYSRPTSACSIVRSASRIRAISPMSPNHCTQLIRQDLLVKRFDDLFSRDRLAAMDSLRGFSDNYENNQRIVFAAVQASFATAKKAFCDWKLRVRSTVAITHCGPETLEEAVQCYINRNVDLYDLPSMVSEVIISLNCNPKIRLPLGVSYSVISTFIRESCRTAWEMSALAFPLDTAFALDAEVFDDIRYRRTYDSDYGAPLVNHHVWPCLMQGLKVIARGEACTRRGASLYIRPSSPIRCSRSRTKSPCPKGILRSKSSYFCR